MNAQQETQLVRRANTYLQQALKHPATKERQKALLEGMFGALLDVYVGTRDETANNVLKFVRHTITRVQEI